MEIGELYNNATEMDTRHRKSLQRHWV